MSQESHRSIHHDLPTEHRRPVARSSRDRPGVLARVKDEIRDDNVPMMAAGMAFYAMLSLFPALIALVTLYGLVASPVDVERQLSSFAQQLPSGAGELVRDQLHGIVATSSSALGLGLLLSLVAALWSASSGAVGMIKAVNQAYDQEPTRGFLKTRLLGIAFTLGAILVVGAAVFLVGVLPRLFDVFGLGDTGVLVASVLRWVGLALLAIIGLGAVYRYAPDRRPRPGWFSWGAVLATLAWLGATALFGFYVSHFGSYQSTYGALGGVIVLLVWLFISGFAVLLGAELNAVLERRRVTGPKHPKLRKHPKRHAVEPTGSLGEPRPSRT